MPETETLKSRLEAKRAFFLREAARVAKLLEAIVEAEHYLEEPSGEPLQAQLILTPPASKVLGEKPDRDRIREALPRMPETFTSADLWRTANTDGHGAEIARSTFAPFFSILKRKGMVIEVQPPKGNTPGIYKKATKHRVIALDVHSGNDNDI